MITTVHFFLNTPTFLLIMIFISLLLKTILLSMLASSLFRSRIIIQPCLFLMTVLIASMVGEIAWSVRLCRNLFFPEIPFSITVFFVRIAWAFLLVQYQSLSLFIRSLTQQRYILSKIQKSLVITSAGFFAYYLFTAFFNNDPTVAEEWALGGRKYFECMMERCTTLYIWGLLVMPTLYTMVRTIKMRILPKILHQQLTTILKYLMMPYLIAELFLSLAYYTYLLVGISIIFITLIIYYCIHKVIKLRFLNVSSHVKATQHFSFVNDFKTVLEQLSLASTRQELAQLTASFLKDSCEIPARKTSLHIRENIISSTPQDKSTPVFEAHIEALFNDTQILHTIKNQKILMYDELAFSNFYEKDPIRTTLLIFLDLINADIFLPIFEKQRIIGYIIVESNARPNRLYSNIERDEMLVFSSYLSNVINLLHHRNFEAILWLKKKN